MVKYIIVHHSGNTFQTFENVEVYHKSKGWNKIGYHYFIEKSGEVKQGRKNDEVGAHCKAHKMNYKSIGVCVAGGYYHKSPSKEQLKSLYDLLETLRERFNLSKSKVMGHKEIDKNEKQCPGNVMKFLKKYKKNYEDIWNNKD